MSKSCEGKRVLLVMVLAGMVALTAASAQELQIPVVVREPRGVARSSEPVSGGIPLPPGTCRPDARFALFDGERSIPVQSLPLVVDRDGYLRWVLLDYALDLDAHEVRALTLKLGTPPSPRTQLQLRDRAEAITIDTGRVTLVIAKDKPFGLFQKVLVNGEPVVTEGIVEYTDGRTGKTHHADVPAKVQVLYKGPLRATVMVRGRFAGDEDAGRLFYATYITAWANRSDVLVKHSLINSNENQRYFVKLGRSRLTLHTSLDGARVTLGAEPDKALTVSQHCSVTQGLLPHHRGRDISSAARITAAGRDLWQGQRAEGYLAVSGKKGSIVVVDRLFRGDPPRKLEVTGEGKLILDAAPKRFESLKYEDSRGNERQAGEPFASDYRWLYDCSHHSSEYRIDFAAPVAPNPEDLSRYALATRGRVWGFAPGDWVSKCQALGVGHFGTLEDEKSCHQDWGWQAKDEATWPEDPDAFVAWEDNHYESEADSVEGLILMFLRTGNLGYWDEAQSWARYHTDLQAFRTEGWQWKDGGVWWLAGGPQGNRRTRQAANVKFQYWYKGTPDERTLWHTSIAKACYCHFYGAGLVDYYCLTGDTDALDAAVDNCEMKYDELTHFRDLTPGKGPLGSTRGFGRGFYVAARTWMVCPDHPVLDRLVRLCRDVYVQLPDEYLDERGVYAPVQKKAPGSRYLTPGIKAYMEKQRITVDDQGTFRDAAGNTWKWRNIGGTWMIAYIQNALELLARQTHDEDLIDCAVAAGEFTAKFMQSPVSRQTWYYTALDIPHLGHIWDGWKYDGLARNKQGEGPKHSGWYTRFFPDACARAYTWVGEKHLMEAGRRLWSYGNRRGYQTTHLTPHHSFAHHRPPKDDSILSTARLFYHGAHPRRDSLPPETITSLVVVAVGAGKATIAFTAPADRVPTPRVGMGAATRAGVVRYQVKCASLPILPYEEFDYARDKGKKRNWWRAVNLQGEPAPGSPGTVARFTVTGVPEGEVLHFAVRSFDDAGNRSHLSNVVKVVLK